MIDWLWIAGFVSVKIGIDDGSGVEPNRPTPNVFLDRDKAKNLQHLRRLLTL